VARLQLTRKRKRTPRVEIIPMVDVMFLLLVFYILSSLALHTQKGIPVSLPGAASGETASAPEDFVITITRSGDYFLNKIKVPSGGLASALKQWSDSLPGGPDAFKKSNVVLNADMKVEHHYVVEAMDQLRRLGINNFMISTDPERVRS
jgi:biopolymer transport protein ExbD